MYKNRICTSVICAYCALCAIAITSIGTGLSTLAWAQSGPTLFVTTDMDCNWKLDGRPMGVLKADNSKVAAASPGEHLIEAVSTDGIATLRTKVQSDHGQQTVEIQMKSQHDQQLEIQRAENARKRADADAALHSTWTDPTTSLMWTKKDNGSDVDWNQATAYCSKLKLAGHSNWRLPTIEELQGIYDPSISSQKVFDNGDTYNVHVKGNLNLTGWDWSSSIRKPGWAWQLVFGKEQPQHSFPLWFSYSSRALCVHPYGE